MNHTRYVQKAYTFARSNYIVSLIVFIVLVTLFASVLKSFSTEEKFVYVKMKVSQGLWWANTQRPSVWYAQSIQKGETEKSLSGEPIAEIVSVRYYPYWGPDQYDIYATVRVSVSEDKKTGKYMYNRSALGVSSPIDFEFSSVVLSGTILDISLDEFNETYTEKIITLEKKFAPLWEYDAVEIGDTYFDGEEVVFEIVDKERTNSYTGYSTSGNNYPVEAEMKQNIIVTARVKVQNKNGQYVFGEEQILVPGKIVNAATSQFVFNDYTLSSIETVDG